MLLLWYIFFDEKGQKVRNRFFTSSVLHALLEKFILYFRLFQNVFSLEHLSLKFSYNMNENPKNNILLSENIRQKRLTILEYFDAYICHHYQHHYHFRLITMANICIEIFQNCESFFVWYFPTIRCYFSDYRSYDMCYNCQEETVFEFLLFLKDKFCLFLCIIRKSYGKPNKETLLLSILKCWNQYY